MDYSLLVGLHFRESATDSQASGLGTPTGYFASFSEVVFWHIGGMSKLLAEKYTVISKAFAWAIELETWLLLA